MARERRLDTYADALFAAQRGFLIIGLTGYTGSGCTTAARMLVNAKKLDLRGVVGPLAERWSGLSKRHLGRLQFAWNQTPWEPFTVIEVAAVIFSVLAKSALEHSYQTGFMGNLRRICVPYRDKLTGLKALSMPLPIETALSEDLVRAYEECAKLMLSYKKSIALADFIRDMQLAGDKIRLFGGYNGSTPHPKNMLVLPEAIRKIISAYKKVCARSRFVIDSFRNPFEVEYFKRRYAEFYLIAMIRNKSYRLSWLRKSLLKDEDIEKIWEKEDGKTFARKKSNSKPEKTKDNIAWWVTGQNIPDCVQKADMFIVNTKLSSVKFHIAKLLALAHKPGCLTPTEDERGMQIAATARLMSGCLSRQVGAAVIGPHGYVLGIGWNDPPEGQIPCALRSCRELLENNGETDRQNNEIKDRPFSEYERSSQFLRHIESKTSRKPAALDSPFCFRTELQEIEGGKKRAEYTRALHAEENAFLQTAKVGGTTVVNSILYTTSSTCTLCAKKAYQLGVKRIIYVEQYEGIAYEQTIATGREYIECNQFEGIAGSAFFSLYSPLMPEKDLIAYYG